MTPVSASMDARRPPLLSTLRVGYIDFAVTNSILGIFPWFIIIREEVFSPECRKGARLLREIS